MTPDRIPLEEAIRLVIGESRQLRSEPAHLREAITRVLGEPLVAPFDLPREPASLMDGYAVRASETHPGALFKVAFEIRAGGVAPRPLEAGEAARILTGAPLPEGADAIVKQEDVSRKGDRLMLGVSVAAGDHVRAAGSDARAGDVLIDAGEEIDAGALSLAASTGIDLYAVSQRPVVSILATGDELRPVGQALTPGTIYETNTWGLAAQAREAGGLPAVLGTVPDDADAIAAALTGARADIYVTSGGASVGDYDFARTVMEKLGGRKVFWQVAIRPGRPVLFGVIPGRAPTLFFALPGNPAASALAFDLFVRPAIRTMVRAKTIRRPRVKAFLGASVTKPKDLTQLVRGTLHSDAGRLVFQPAALQGSMSIPSLRGLGAVGILPEEITQVEAGELIDVEPWAPVNG